MVARFRCPTTDQSLLDALRDRLGKRSPKDGCSPQGQCGCCTVLVDGQPRVACVTPTRRMRGRACHDSRRADHRRPRTLGRKPSAPLARASAGSALRASSCASRVSKTKNLMPAKTMFDRLYLPTCVGARAGKRLSRPGSTATSRRELAIATWMHAARRADIEGHGAQRVSPAVALGEAGFADDLAPHDSLVAVLSPRIASGSLARRCTKLEQRPGKIQGRRTTLEPNHPIAVPDGDWQATLQNHLGRPGISGDRRGLGIAGRRGRLTACQWRSVRRQTHFAGGRGGGAAGERTRACGSGCCSAGRTRCGWAPKRPPVGGGANADGTGILRVVATPGIEAAVAAVVPELTVVPHRAWERAHNVGSPESSRLGRSGRIACVGERRSGRSPRPARAGPKPRSTTKGIRVRVGAGDSLDPVVLRSYCIGAAHMGIQLGDE